MTRKTSIATQIVLGIFECAGIAAWIVVFIGYWVALP